MHATIADIVGAIRPHDALEEEHISKTAAWIESGVPLCRIEKPDVPPQHLVAYFVLFDSIRRKLLLVDHKNSGLWLPSGGHVEPGEDPKAAVRREAYEELKVEASFWCQEPLFLTVTETVGQTRKHVDVSLWYVLKGDFSQILWFDVEEFYQIRWYSIDDLPLDRTDPHLTRFAEKLLEREYDFV